MLVKQFFTNMTYIQDKIDCRRVAVIVQLVWLAVCGLDR